MIAFEMALKGLKVIEMVGLAPAPFCGLILSDFGANVIRVEKMNDMSADALKRGKKSITVDLKRKEGQQIIKKLASSADVLLEPFRPGVMEKLSLGPEELAKINERLIYARLSGFGQSGALMKEAGHDINYLSISGILSILGGKSTPPLPPINILGDFAGGGLICALGICMSIIERQKSGKGQVIDANIVEGTSYVSSWIWHTRKTDYSLSQVVWPCPGKRESNLLDGGSPMYAVYETKDSKYMAVGALEPQFYLSFLKCLGLDPSQYSQFDSENFPNMKTDFQNCFKKKTQQEWIDIFAGKDACVTPVVELNDAQNHNHNISRSSFLSDGTPRPSPVLSRTPAEPSLKEPSSGEHTEEVLKEVGYTDDEINQLVDEKVIYVNKLKSSL